MKNRLEERYIQKSAREFEDFIKMDGNYIVSKIKVSDIIDLSFDTQDDPKGLIFEDCIFAHDVEISGTISNGIEFINCSFEAGIFLGVNIEYIDGGNTGQIGIYSSLYFFECQINLLIVKNSFIQRGIKISNNCIVKSLKIENIKVIENFILNLNDSKITERFDIEDIDSDQDLIITNSDILCFSRFESVSARMLSIQESNVDRILFWGSSFNKSISIDKSEFNGTVEFIATTVLNYFGLYNSTFNKEISVANIDKTNGKDSTINHYFIVNCNFDAGFKAIENTPSFYPKLTLTFSSSLKGIMLFEKIKFSNVNLRGHNDNLALTFDDCLFNEINLNNVTNNQTIRLSKCQANSGTSLPTKLSIQNSNLGKMNLLDVDFKSFTNISIVDSFISEIQFASIKWFEKHQLTNSNQENREAFRQLKLAAEKSSDNIAAIDFKGNELYYYHKYLEEITPKSSYSIEVKNLYIYYIFYFPLLFLNKLLSIISFLFSKEKAKYNISNKMILWLARVSNNYGSSWTRPLFLILGFNLFFFVLMGISLSNKITWTFDPSNIGLTCSEVTKHFSLFFQLLNPTHDINRVLASLQIDTAKETVSWTVYAFDFIHRIIYAYLIYQLVVAFRKFVK